MNFSSKRFFLFVFILYSICAKYVGQEPISEEEIPPIAKIEPRTGFEYIDKQSDVFYEHGLCGTWNEEYGEYVPALKHSYEPEIIKSIEDFNQIANRLYERTKICGDPYYELRKQCIMVHAFENGPIDKSAIISGDKKDVALVFFDGCITCNLFEIYKEENNVTRRFVFSKKAEEIEPTLPEIVVEIWASYEWKEGSRFTKCFAETKKGLKSTVKLAKMQVGPDERFINKWIQNGHIYNAASFYQRICFGIFSADDMADRFEGVKLHIKHNCNLAGESVDLEYSLPDIVPGDHPNHIAEMRGLKLELHENKMSHVHFYSDGSHVESHGLYWDSLRKNNG